MNRDTIKYMAAAAMLVDHIGFIFLKPPLSDIAKGLGNFTAVTMCYFLVEGYGYTRSRKKYALRLLLFALVSQIPYRMALGGTSYLGLDRLNIMFNLLICFGILYINTEGVDFPAGSRRREWTALLIMLSLFCDWSFLAPLLVLLFMKAGDDPDRKARAWALFILAFGILYFLADESGATLTHRLVFALTALTGPMAAALVLLCFYNGKQSARFRGFHKWFFYLFYPAHLFVLALLK